MQPFSCSLTDCVHHSCRFTRSLKVPHYNWEQTGNSGLIRGMLPSSLEMAGTFRHENMSPLILFSYQHNGGLTARIITTDIFFYKALFSNQRQTRWVLQTTNDKNNFKVIKKSRKCNINYKTITISHKNDQTKLDIQMVVAFSSTARFLGECSTIHCQPALLFVCVFKVEISSHTLIPLFRPG